MLFSFSSRLLHMRSTKLAFLLLALTTAASAQTTWKNLHFGQSRDQVRSSLATQNFPVETSAEGSLQSVSDYQLLLPGMRYALPMRADFHFDDAGGLVNIVLSLDIPAMKQNFAYRRQRGTAMIFAAEKLTRALTEKYAAPLNEKDDCTVEAATLARRPSPAPSTGTTPGSPSSSTGSPALRIFTSAIRCSRPTSSAQVAALYPRRSTPCDETSRPSPPAFRAYRGPSTIAAAQTSPPQTP